MSRIRMDPADVDIRIATLEGRLSRLSALPLAQHTSIEERLAEVERRVSSLQVRTAMMAVHSTSDVSTSLERIEEAVSEAEQARGYWSK